MPLVLFLDESGDHSLGKIDPQYPVFVLCGVIMEEQYHHSNATDALSEFKLDLLAVPTFCCTLRILRESERDSRQ